MGRIVGIGSLYLLLVGLIGMELLPGRSAVPVEGTPNIPHQAAPSVVDMASSRTAWASIAVQQPILARSRKPPQAAAPSGPDLPRLSGTISAAKVTLAILELRTGGSITVGVGDTVADWRIQNVRADAVTLAQGDRAVTLQIGYEKASAPASEEEQAPGTTIAWPGEWSRSS